MIVVAECGSKHEKFYSIKHPRVVITPVRDYVKVLCERYAPESVGLGEYFSNYVPFSSTMGMLKETVETPQCDHNGCRLNTDPKTVRFFWPLVLTITSDINNTTTISNNLRFDEHFKILGTYETEVRYELVGRILHRKDHFTAEILLGGTAYTYDDMKHGGKLRKVAGTQRPFKKRTPHEVYYVYHRVSTTNLDSVGQIWVF